MKKTLATLSLACLIPTSSFAASETDVIFCQNAVYVDGEHFVTESSNKDGKLLEVMSSLGVIPADQDMDSKEGEVDAITRIIKAVQLTAESYDGHAELFEYIPSMDAIVLIETGTSETVLRLIYMNSSAMYDTIDGLGDEEIQLLDEAGNRFYFQRDKQEFGIALVFRIQNHAEINWMHSLEAGESLRLLAENEYLPMDYPIDVYNVSDRITSVTEYCVGE